MKRAIVAIAIVAAAGALVLRSLDNKDSDPALAVVLPDLSTTAAAGETLFSKNCSTCHGENATGTDNGPPLIHKYYEPNHHGDAAFYVAVTRGVRAHHWSYGNMPPVEGLNEDQIGQIVAYVREVQRANGIN